MTGYFYFPLFWGDLLVSVSFITAEESRRNEPAETSETRGTIEGKRGREGGRKRMREGIYFAGLNLLLGQACPC